MAMKDLLINWTIGLVMMLGGGFFSYGTLKDIKEHVKRYKEEKTAKESLRFWYLEWIFIVWEIVLGRVRPALVISLLFFLLGTVIFVLDTMRIVGKLFGYDFVF